MVRLVGCKGITVGIVTGRVVSDIRRKVGVRGVILAANHGYEVWRGGRCVLRKGGRFRAAMKALGRSVEERLGDVRGMVIENKEYSVAMHYRLVSSKKKPWVKREIARIASPYCDRHSWEMMRGKEVIEIRPRDFWNKGSAVEWIRKRYAPKAFTFYIGDDTTDEDAFRALAGSGVTVRAGMCAGSAARYFVRDIEEIVPFVEWLSSRSGDG